MPPFRRLIARFFFFFFYFLFFFFLRSLFLAIITNRQRESPRQRFDDVYAQLLRWQSNIGDGLGDWVSVGIYLSLKCLCVVFFFLVQSSNFIFFFLTTMSCRWCFFYVTFFIRVFVYSFCSSLYSYCRGTHGYMAPEVLSKGTAYDSSADWFSFGCMLYKLLKGHSPFRQHKTKDKHEIDRMTLTMVLYPPYTLCI